MLCVGVCARVHVCACASAHVCVCTGARAGALPSCCALHAARLVGCAPAVQSATVPYAQQGALQVHPVGYVCTQKAGLPPHPSRLLWTHTQEPTTRVCTPLRVLQPCTHSNLPAWNRALGAAIHSPLTPGVSASALGLCAQEPPPYSPGLQFIMDWTPLGWAVRFIAWLTVNHSLVRACGRARAARGQPSPGAHACGWVHIVWG